MTNIGRYDSVEGLNKYRMIGGIDQLTKVTIEETAPDTTETSLVTCSVCTSSVEVQTISVIFEDDGSAPDWVCGDCKEDEPTIIKTVNYIPECVLVDHQNRYWAGGGCYTDDPLKAQRYPTHKAANAAANRMKRRNLKVDYDLEFNLYSDGSKRWENA